MPRRKMTTGPLAAAACSAALAASLLLSGCNTANSRRALATSAPISIDNAASSLSELGYSLDWTLTTGIAVQPVRHFSIHDDVLLVHDVDNVLTLRDAQTGASRWVQELADPIAKFVGNTVIDDRVYASGEGELQIIDANTGALIDRQRLDTTVNTEPLVTPSILVYGSSNGQVLGHNYRTGLKAWGYQLTSTIIADPVAVGNDVAIVDQAGEVIILEPGFGTSRGRINKVFDGLANNPVADRNTLYVASRDQSVYAFSAQDASEIWRLRTEWPITEQPLLLDGVLYIVLRELGLTAVGAASGEILWNNADITAGHVLTSRKDELLHWDGDTLWSIDARRGDVLDSADIPNTDRVLADSPTDGSLYFVATNGSILKFRPR